jgi:predicted dehydrogenase
MTDHVGVGMLGYAFMGKAHSNALRTLAYMTWPPPLIPDLVAISGRDEAAVREAADRYGFAKAVGDWREIVEDPDVDVFDNVSPNHLHAEPSIAAAQAGKHVICEKPLGRDAGEAYETWQRVAAAGVVHMCAFNYRFVPAVRLAREMLEAGELGEIRHFRASYLQDWLSDPTAPATWRLDAGEAGSGALGDLGAHIIDIGRYLVGEITSVGALTRTFVPERPGGRVTVDDAFEAFVEFEGGVIGTLEASRFALGRKNAMSFEINGSRGSLRFELERLNELQVHQDGAPGFRTVLVTDANQPFMQHWWPAGHVIGWEHTFVHELHHFLTAVRDGGRVGPHGADFQDGYRAAEVCDALVRSAGSGAREPVTYRS